MWSRHASQALENLILEVLWAQKTRSGEFSELHKFDLGGSDGPRTSILEGLGPQEAPRTQRPPQRGGK
eukprot:6092392-Karenia_brevis.AAC.1